jgi:hypothetical protein
MMSGFQRAGDVLVIGGVGGGLEVRGGARSRLS